MYSSPPDNIMLGMPNFGRTRLVTREIAVHNELGDFAMAVVIKYIVVRDGVEKMTFSTKKEADAYDRQLDISENLYDLLESSSIDIDTEKLEEISLFLAQHSDQAVAILKGSKPKQPQKSETGASKPAVDANTKSRARSKSAEKAV
jgi:dsDNA-binding SOS-regulon protein